MSATQAHLEALDGADVVSVGPAGVITSSWRCSARAERRAAADRTGLLHSLAAAAPRAPRLPSGRWEASKRTGAWVMGEISTGRTLNHCDMHAATVTCMQPCAYDHETSQQRSVLI